MDIAKTIKEKEVKFINLCFADIAGRLRLLTVPAQEIDTVLEEGLCFDGSSVGFGGVESSDFGLIPEPESFAPLPWEPPETRGACMICDIYSLGKQAEVDPRWVLKKEIKRMKQALGGEIEYMVAPEMEFFLFEKEGGKITFHDRGRYLSTLPDDRGYDLSLRKEISIMLEQMGICPVKAHHEVPASKHEIDFMFGPAIKMADAALLYKFAVKSAATAKGLVASFMPKPFAGEYGAGMHVHQCLLDHGENVFYGREGALSDLTLHFIGGLLDHAKALTAITCPTINSYKRLVPGWEAPSYVSWATHNRSVLIRVPSFSRPKGARIEYRAPDGSCNLYLALAVMLAAGIDGIKREVEPPPMIEESVYRMTPAERRRQGIGSLPSNLSEALDALERDELIRESLGEQLYKRFVDLKRGEWREYSVQVGDWGREKYLNV